MTRVLVAYGSTRGGTEGVAETIGEDLREHGHDAVVRPAAEVERLTDVDAVVVAGALYAGRWHKDARRFVRRHARGLSQVPVWLVATGPLDASATTKEIPPVGHVRAAATADRRTRDGDVRGAAARRMPPGSRPPPWRRRWPATGVTHEQIARWVDTIDEELAK